MKIENYIPHIELVLKCYQSIINDYNNLMNEVETIAIKGFVDDITKFYNEILPYYNMKDIDKVKCEIVEKNIRKIFDIEQLCKKYIIKIWKDTLTAPNLFKNSDDFDFLVYSFDFDIQNFTDTLEKIPEISLNYISNKNFGVDNRNYGIILKIEEEDLIVSSNDKIYLDIQDNQDNLFLKIFKRNSLKKYILENKLMFHDKSTLLMTPKIMKQKIIEKEMKVKGTLLGMDGNREYTNSVVVNTKTTLPVAFFLIDDGSNNFSTEIEKLHIYSDIYNIPVVVIDKKIYEEKLENVYKKNTI